MALKYLENELHPNERDVDNRPWQELLNTSAFDQQVAPRQEALQIAGALERAMETIKHDYPDAAAELGREYFPAFIKRAAFPQERSLAIALASVERTREEIGDLANVLAGVLQAWDSMCRANPVWGVMMARALAQMHGSTRQISFRHTFKYAPRPDVVPPDLSDEQVEAVLEEMRGHMAAFIH